MLLYSIEANTLQSTEGFQIPKDHEIVWIHQDREQFQESAQQIKEFVELHPLIYKVLEKHDNRPKILFFQQHIFLCFYALLPNFRLSEINLIVGKKFLVSIAEDSLSFWKSVSRTFQQNPVNMRHTGHILYHVLDELVENNLYYIDRIAEEILKIQQNVFDNPFENEIGHRIFQWRNQIHVFRKHVEDEMEIIRQVIRSDLPYVDEEAGFFFQDLIDDFSRVVDAFDAFQEQLFGIIDLQTSLKADHMNSIMKTLTLVSVIFIPITFLVGVYGMNFENMPELHWKYGYFILWGILLTIISGTIIFFRKRRWW
jgi:magnesium transporter